MKLDLSPEEAAVLFFILQNVGGNPEEIRGYADSIHARMTNPEREAKTMNMEYVLDPNKSSIYFLYGATLPPSYVDLFREPVSAR